MNKLLIIKFLITFILFSQLSKDDQFFIPAPAINIVKHSKELWEIDRIFIDHKNKEIFFNAELLNPEELEVLICNTRGRAYESLLLANISPSQLQFALYLLGLNTNKKFTWTKKRGDLVDISIQYLNQLGIEKREKIQSWIIDKRTNKIMKTKGWHFIGTDFIKNFPQAEGNGNIALIFSLGSSILDNSDIESDKDNIFTVNHKNLINNQQVKVILSISKSELTN